MRARPSSSLYAAIVLALAGCGDSTQARRGVEGASCDKTSDCVSPLQCFQNVCGGEKAPGIDAQVSDAVESEDLGIEDVEWDFPEAPSPEAVRQALDGFLEDVEGEEVLEDVPGPADAPTLDGSLNPISDCTSLGVAPNWIGDFTGNIEYSLTVDLGVPPKGTMPVQGILSFEIQCIDLKLLVFGSMEGTAQGEYPFSLKLSGSFNPDTGKLNAVIKEGKVTIIIATVGFEGQMSGTLAGLDSMAGQWDGYSTETNPPGLGEATGAGAWTAAPE